MGFYSQAIDAKPGDPVLLESLFLNRAVCNLELSESQSSFSEHLLMIAENYGSVLRDCSKVLSTNQSSLKALYRSALALIALERPIEALDCCERGLRIDPDSDGLKGTREKAQKLKEEQELRERKKIEKLEAKKRDEQRLAKALKVS
jgi:tetratricopeptide (TPR) repeat protein